MQTLKSICIFLLVLLSCCAVLADGVLRTDPNTPTAISTKPEPVTEKDTRLDQKVTYYSGYKRLHVVTDELSQMTGVVIYSGLSSRNWQVRDIPMVVCVKDLPLGKVLQAIAEAAHLRLSSRKIEDQGKVTWTYRFPRSVKEDVEIDTLLEKKHAKKMEILNWDWEALRKCGQQPERQDIDKRTYVVSKLLASLDESAKDEVFNYGVISFKGSDPKYSAIIHEFYKMTWNEMGKMLLKEGEVAATPPDSDLQRTSLDIKFNDSRATGEASIDCSLDPIHWRLENKGGGFRTSWREDLTTLANRLRDVKGLDLPPYPKDTAVSSDEEDMSNPEMIILKGESWNRPVMDQKLDLQQPPDKQTVQADLIEAISRATGMNIVCDDFMSHKIDSVQYMLPELCVKDITLRHALQGVWYRWFINDEDHLLVGWSWGRGDEWRLNYKSLVQESYLLSLQKKLDNEGLDIDDVAAFAELTPEQFCEWIVDSRYLKSAGQGWPSNMPLWRLYSQLNAEDKALAKSPQGLPLAKLDRAKVASAFQEEKAICNRFTGLGALREEDERKLLEDAMTKQQVMDDPDLIPGTVMKLIKAPAKYYTAPRMLEGSEVFLPTLVPAGLNLSEYKLEIRYGQDADQSLVFDGPGLTFPAYSHKRMAEVLKESKP